MKRRRQSQRRDISYKKERVVLSDVLPYELPLIFTNRYLYRFLIENGIESKNGTIQWNAGDKALDEIIRLLFGAEPEVAIKTKDESRLGKKIVRKELSHNRRDFFVSIPFQFRISHKDSEFRELTICHPRNQVQMVEFYHKYKELILYYCSVSPFSIRRPSKISRFTYHDDRMHRAAKSTEHDGVEEIDKEYENLRSFFVFDKYSYIYKFYESDQFHRCEKRYNKLLKLDIAKCFDSIYTHTLSWALLNKEAVKENLEAEKTTFSGVFDRIMHQLNYGETNGIVIGPEFSRIFAELILQAVDQRVCSRLEQENLSHAKHFEIFRYVDDYFIFYNEEKDAENIVRALQVELKLYRLHLNSGKALRFEKPIITGISMAKHRIGFLLDEKISYRIGSEAVVAKEGAEGLGEPVRKTGSIYVRPGTLITQFKTIIKECQVSYRDMLNFSLSVVERRCNKLISDFGEIEKTDSSEAQLTKAILGVIEFSFFIYSVSPRANTTIRLSRVLQVFISFVKQPSRSDDIKHSVFKMIYDNIHFILEKNRSHAYAQVETVFLLIVLGELGRGYWLEESLLESYIKYSQNGETINYVSIVVLLFYMKNKKRYNDLRLILEDVIRKKFDSRRATMRKDAELTFLFFDCISCPFVSELLKSDLFDSYGVTDLSLRAEITKKRKFWFTTWVEFELALALDAKRSMEVY